MKKTVVGKVLLGFISVLYLGCAATPFAFAAANNRFDNAITDSVQSIQQQTDMGYNGTQGGAQGVADIIVDIVKKIITPIVIVSGVVVAILGMYQMFTSDKDDATKKGMNYLIRGVVGIIVMVSASFLADTVVNGWIFAYSASWELLGNISAQRIYRKMIFPFLKMAMLLVMGVLFLIALFRTFEFITSPSDDVKKKAKTIILRNSFWILFVIFAKRIIEAIYGTEAQVTSVNTTNLGQIGWGILEDKQLPFAYTVINWAMGLLGIFLLAMIILQSIKLLTDPTDEGTQKALRKNVVYMIIGLIIMATAYVVTNFIIVK